MPKSKSRSTSTILSSQTNLTLRVVPKIWVQSAAQIHIKSNLLLPFTKLYLARVLTATSLSDPEGLVKVSALAKANKVSKRNGHFGTKFGESKLRMALCNIVSRSYFLKPNHHELGMHEMSIHQK